MGQIAVSADNRFVKSGSLVLPHPIRIGSLWLCDLALF